jgi:hypothetical protein
MRARQRKLRDQPKLPERSSEPKFRDCCSTASTLPAVTARTIDTLQVPEAGGNQPERMSPDGTQARWQAIDMKPLPKRCRPGAGGLAGMAVAIVAVAGALCGPHLLVSTPAARHATKIGNDGSIRVGPNACQRAEHLARCGPTRTRVVADKSPETAARAPDP